MVKFYNTLLVISTVDCDEFHQGLRSEKLMIGNRIALNFYNTLLVILTLNCGEFLQRTLGNFDGEMW